MSKLYPQPTRFSKEPNNLGVSWHDGIATDDIDLARHVKLAINQDNGNASVAQPIDIMKSLDVAGFSGVPSLNNAHPPTTFRHPSKIKVAFLTPLTGKPSSTPRMLSGMHVYAEPLRFLDYLIHKPQASVLLTKYGTMAYVPQAARYAFHKCIVAQYRNNDLKRHKDILQAELIFKVLEERLSFLIKDAWDALPWKGKAEIGLSEFQDKELISNLKGICNENTSDI